MWLTTLILLAVAPLVLACSVPVFRYALERWEAAPYHAMVFHREPLADAQQQLVIRLSMETATNQPPTRLLVQTFDLNTAIPAEAQAIWKRHETTQLPLLVICFPQGAPAKGEAWAGPLTGENTRQIIDSPIRRQIAQRLIKGDSAVWVLLESGDKAKDSAAARTLETRLAHLQRTLKLQKIEEEDLTNRLVSVPESALRVAFSMVRVSRNDPGEQLLVHSLLGTEEDLPEGREIMAFPVFGRGRALCALIGAGINDEMIDETCQFLIGPCSCVVKEENPGLDLPFAVDWDAHIYRTATRDLDEPPPLTSLGTFAEPTNKSSGGAVTVAVAGVSPAPVGTLRYGLGAVVGMAALIFAAGALLLRQKRH